MTPLGLCYLGSPTHSLDAAQVIERRTNRSLRVLSVSPDRVREVVSDDRIDAVLCGTALDKEAIQNVVDTVAETDDAVPVFDLTAEAVAVPETVAYHHLYPGMGPEEAADRILEAVDDSPTPTEPGDATLVDDRDRPVFQGMDGYVAVDEDGRVTRWGPTLVEWTDVAAETARGQPLAEVFPPADAEPFRAARDRVAGGGDPEVVEFETSDGDGWYCVRVVPTGTGGLRCFVRDVTDRKIQEAEMEATRERFENTLERITDAFFVLDNEEEFVLLNSRAEFVLDVDADEVVGERFWDVFPAAVSTTFYHEFGEAMDTQEPTSFEEYYRPLDAWFEVTAYPSEDGLSVFLRDVTDRVELQRKLESLHEITRQLIVAETDDDIAEDAVAAAVEVLDFPLTICWRYDDTRRRLDPLAHSRAVTDRVETVQPIEPGDGLAWDAYEDGERRVIDSVAVVTPNSHHPGDVASSLLVPLGEYGLLGTYSDEEAAFDETDVELFRILATAVESALARARRERQLARRNERLDDFASTVSHDLRNPLHVASARTELARETGDPEHLETVADSLERMEELIEDLLARARGEQDLDREPLSLDHVARDAWRGVDTAEATLSVEADATFSADPTRLTQLFENLYRNAVEHGGEAVTVRVGTHDDGFYVEDDGPGIPADEREDVFEQGVTGTEDGTGYGLAIVADVVDGHGWTVDVTESVDGGARFEVSHVHSLNEAESESLA